MKIVVYGNCQGVVVKNEKIRYKYNRGVLIMAQLVGPNIKYTGGIHHTYTSGSVECGVWTFKSPSGSFTARTSITCDILIVGGGAGGGNGNHSVGDTADGGGGGAGHVSAAGGSGIVVIKFPAG